MTANVAEMEEQEICITGITSEEWFRKLGGMLVEYFGEEIKDGLNESLAKHEMKFILSPVNENNAKYLTLEKSFGMFLDGKLSSERFIKEKEIEKELEG
ncbi:MAG: hypothetical protein LBK97_02700 [Prevotellaceae bacterium]|jgi:hypothetical protein|nr:hypothetical protein [Prevotellaceae bacterium]